MTLAIRISTAGIMLAMSMLACAGRVSAGTWAFGAPVGQDAFEADPRAGRVSGTLLLGSGEPAEGVRVELVSVDADDTYGRFRRAVAADATGRFQFEQVAPGRYFVGVGVFGRHEGPFVFPATFYPGLSDRALATIIEIRGGARQELAPMMLPAHREAFTLTGRAVYADGRPAAGASVILANGDGAGELTAPIAADDDGGFSFIVYEGLGYLVRAYDAAGDNAAGSGGESEPFVVTGAPAPVTVLVRSGQ